MRRYVKDLDLQKKIVSRQKPISALLFDREETLSVCNKDRLWLKLGGLKKDQCFRVK